jgi:hypothetical protein
MFGVIVQVMLATGPIYAGRAVLSAEESFSVTGNPRVGYVSKRRSPD